MFKSETNKKTDNSETLEEGLGNSYKTHQTM